MNENKIVKLFLIKFSGSWYFLVEKFLPFFLQVSKYQQGMEKGMEKGEEVGKSQRSIEIAKNMLAKGMDAATVMEITGLTESQMQQLM